MAKKSVIEVKILGDNSNLSKALISSQGQVSSWAGSVAKFGAMAAAATVAAGVAVGVGLFKVGQSFDKEFDKIRTGTGATGDALAGLEGSFKNVLKTVPASFGDAGTAIADLNTRLGLTGKPLKNLAGQFINLSRITGTDVKQNVDDITSVFGDWGIATGDQTKSLDAIYRASQASGIGINDLSSSVVQFGAPLRNLGFGFDESLALLAQFNKTGVNTETVFAGLKAGVGKLAKAGEDVPATFRRVVDEITKMGPGTEATALAIELFGQRAGPDLADAIAGGKFSVDEMLAAVAGGSDTINGAAADTADFAEKWQLFKNRILVGLQPLATKVFDGVGKAMDKLGPKVEPIIAWFSDKLPSAVAAVQRVFESAWPKIRAAISDVFDWLVANAWPKVKAVFDGIVTAAREVYDFFNNNRNALVGALVAIGVLFAAWAVSAAAAAVATLAASAPLIAVAAAVVGLGVAFGWAYQNVGWFRDAVDAVASFFVDTVWPVLQDTWRIIVEVVGAIVSTVRENWDTIKAITSAVFEAIRGYLETIWDTIYGVVKGYIEIIRGVIKTVTSLIKGDWSGVWDGIKQILSGAWDAIKAVVSGAIEVVKGYLSVAMGIISGAWSTVWGGIKSTVSDTWNGITGFVSSGIDTLVGFITGLPGRVASGIGSGFNALWENFRSVINRIIDGINSVQLPGVTIGGWDPPGPGPKIPSFTTPTIDPFPYIPRFHSGIDRVPGRPGSEMLAILEAGERVTPARENRQRSDVGDVYYINTKDDPHAIRSELELMSWVARSR